MIEEDIDPLEFERILGSSEKERDAAASSSEHLGFPIGRYARLAVTADMLSQSSL